MIQDSKNMWMCVGNFKNINGFLPSYKSIAYTRTRSIKNLIENNSKNWLWWKRKGWKCIRVDVSYKEIKP